MGPIPVSKGPRFSGDFRVDRYPLYLLREIPYSTGSQFNRQRDCSMDSSCDKLKATTGVADTR